MPEYQNVLYAVEERIARITVNRPRYRNGQSAQLLMDLDAAIATAAADNEVRVIVLLGAGEHFSSGHDLGTPEQVAWKAENMEEGVRGFFGYTWRFFVDMHLRWRNVPKPMIAAVQGYCIYGGWMVASTADLIFAADDAMFLGSLFQYFSIPWDIPARKAKEILFQCRFVDAKDAQELGLVSRVVPRAQLADSVREYALEVAMNDPFDMRMTKLAINQAQDAQGFSAHIHNAHSTYIARYMAEKDPGFKLQQAEGRRRPMVQIAVDRYKREQARKAQEQAS
jgi:enoyl-CoA hydratase